MYRAQYATLGTGSQHYSMQHEASCNGSCSEHSTRFCALNRSFTARNTSCSEHCTRFWALSRHFGITASYIIYCTEHSSRLWALSRSNTAFSKLQQLQLLAPHTTVGSEHNTRFCALNRSTTARNSSRSEHCTRLWALSRHYSITARCNSFCTEHNTRP